MQPAQPHTGEAHKRFTRVITLLYLIDPVRGEPTVHSLDRHPHDNAGHGQQENLQKKFLDSFALVCSTSKNGGETAAAVCLESNHPTGTVIRLARNLEVPPSLVDRLHNILNDLASVATGGLPRKEAESQILYQVIDLTRDKILSLLERLRDPEIQQKIEGAIQNMRNDESFLGDTERVGFQDWIVNLPILTSLQPDTESRELLRHIKWASQAKWVYSQHIQALFCPREEELPPWINSIYKLGRYYSATKNMLKLAIKQPALFTSIHVEPISPPERECFSVGKEITPLRTVLQKLGLADPDQLMSQLGKVWLTDTPESRFRQTCRLELTVHAEMQLLSFYDHHPEHTPRLLFMGTSKKACYLCHEFMSRHPLTIGVSASHQKLYPSWMPAPCSTSAVRKKHKVLLWYLSQHLEETTARDLETRLGVRRRKNLDSTAGPSLPTTESLASWWTEELPIHGRNGSELGPERPNSSGGEAFIWPLSTMLKAI